jgi:hypothetical protein
MGIANVLLLAQSRQLNADECPLLGAKRTLTNRCLPISIYEYGPNSTLPLHWTEPSIALPPGTSSLKPKAMQTACFKLFLHPSPTFVSFAGAAFWLANRLLELLTQTRHRLPITTRVLEPTHTLVQ